MNKSKILVVEDEVNIRMGLEEILRGEDFEVVLCDRGDQAISHYETFKPDLILLDVMLPGMNGYDICKELRKRKISTPILMLTAKGQELDKVIGLDLGADDYVTKPFGVRELVARIYALLRRIHGTPIAMNEDPFQIGQANINPKTFQLLRGKTTHTLTAKELKLLQFFYLHQGEVLSRDRLLNEVWGYEYYGTTRTLDQTIVQLRKKLGDSGANARLLVSIHGVGYKLAEQIP